ncbi:hypothetical protein KQX54_020763 [Cotesia glomerata]|uniref:Uncharacterized protein n=1 Tax=Cotesia glomerata TaxID=32391 RepID=A0AAV7I2N5_COTGL|nr:hypothetical protein KQX54_020763 [Cotesia glomerata]
MRLHPVFPTIPLLSSDYRDSSRSPGIPSVAARDYVFSIFTVSMACPFLPGKESPDLWLLNGDGDGDLDAAMSMLNGENKSEKNEKCYRAMHTSSTVRITLVLLSVRRRLRSIQAKEQVDL